MTTPITVNIPHQLGRAEARRRIEDGFAKVLQQLPGGGASHVTENWDGDRLAFSASALGQAVRGVIDVLDDTVRLEIELPGLLGALAKGLEGRLRKAGLLLLARK